MQRGRIISFDPLRGYGFVAPDGGGEDIFLHVNELADGKHLARPNVVVEFTAVRGDRGLTATGARIIHSEVPLARPAPKVVSRNRQDLSDDEYEVIPESDFIQEMTEVLLACEPTLTARQILSIRVAMVKMAAKYDWIES